MKVIKFRQWTGLRYRYWGYDVNGCSFSSPIDDVPSDQFIGLQDRKGVDIYERDLLLCTSGAHHDVIYESYFASFNTRHLASGEVSDITKDGMAECFEVLSHSIQVHVDLAAVGEDICVKVTLKDGVYDCQPLTRGDCS
jgi:hypothetical protein